MAPYCFADGRNKNSEGERFEVRLQTPFAARTELTKIETSSFALHKIARFSAGKIFPSSKSSSRKTVSSASCDAIPNLAANSARDFPRLAAR